MVRDSPHLSWSVACSRTWASVAGFQITQPQLSAAGPASVFFSHMPAARTISHMDPDRVVCNPKGGFPGALTSGPRSRCPGYPLHQRTRPRLAAPGGDRNLGSLLLAAGLLTVPCRSPAWGFSPPHRVGREAWAPPTKLRGSPTTLNGKGSLESLLLAAGFPRPWWEHSLGSFFSATGFPKSASGSAAQGLSSRPEGDGSHGPEWEPRAGSLLWAKRFPQWGNSSTLRGSYSSGWEQRTGSCLRVDGFLGCRVGSQSEAPPPGCGVPIAQGGNPDWDPLHPVRSWCRRQSARCSRRPNSPPPGRGASSSLRALARR